MDLKSRMSEVVSSILDNKNGTSTVIYKNGNRTRIEYMPTAQATMLAEKSKEDEKKMLIFERHNGHLHGEDEVQRRMTQEAETFRQLRRKVAMGQA